MNSLLMWTPLAAGVFVLLIWLLASQRSRATGNRTQSDQLFEKLLPVHYRYFPQIQQALSVCDEDYLRQRASSRVMQRVLRERRKVARRFLSGLLEDFSNLERLARTVAALSPEVSREQEFERLMLGVKFRLLYTAVWVRLSVGRIPLRNIEHLAGLIGRLANQMEQAMAAISELSQPGLTDNPSA